MTSQSHIVVTTTPLGNGGEAATFVWKAGDDPTAYLHFEDARDYAGCVDLPVVGQILHLGTLRLRVVAVHPDRYSVRVMRDGTSARWRVLLHRLNRRLYYPKQRLILTLLIWEVLEWKQPNARFEVHGFLEWSSVRRRRSLHR